jgi:hypothetical protein
MDVEVIRKDGLILIREMAAEVKNMMDIKMNAVMVSTVCQFLIRVVRFVNFSSKWDKWRLK